MIRKIVKKIVPKSTYPIFRTYHLRCVNSITYIRSQKLITKILGPGWQRNQEDIEIDITYDCDVKCLNCSRSCRQAPSKEEITLKQIKKFVNESINKNKKWRTIRVLGGEPTLHKDLIPILELLIDYKKTFSPNTFLQIVTNGFGKDNAKILAQIPKEINIKNTSKKTANQKFYLFNKAPIDNPRYKYADYSGGCPVLNLCMILTPYGYYNCPAMIGVDRALGLNLGEKELPNKNNQLRNQCEELCKYCGFFGYGATERYNKEVMSKSWKKIYKDYHKNPPKLTKY